MTIRAADRSRFFVPLLLSGAFFSLYYFLDREKRLLAGVRTKLFGPDLNWLVFIAATALFLFCMRVIDALIFDVMMRRRRNVLAPQLLRQILFLFLSAIFLTIASNKWLGFSLTAALATGTVLAAVIGLALQDTLGNLFSGIALHMEGGFEVGDVLHSGDYTGVVEQVSWRATRMRGFNSQTVVLPNSVIARERLEVYPKNNLNARVLQIGVDYNIPPATVIGILMQAATHIDGVAREVPCVARVGAFGDSAVVYEIKYFTRDYSLRDRIDAEIRKAVWYALRRNDISFATPIRAYQQYTPPAKVEHSLSSEEVHDLLHKVDILSPLPDDAHEVLAAAARVHFYSRGEAILRRAAAGDSMFIIHSGTVSVRLTDDSPRGWHEVAQLGGGNFVGEMALLTGEARTADVIATSDVVTVEIRKESLEPILHGNPDLAAAISEKVTQRKDHLDSLKASGKEEEQSVLARIRAYFGL